MPTDKGVRSIEVNVANMTPANFTVQGPELIGPSSEWIKNEEPTQGEPLLQYQSARWGFMTNDYNSSAGGQVALAGYGEPLPITFNNDQNNKSTCTCPGSSQVSAFMK